MDKIKKELNILSHELQHLTQCPVCMEPLDTEHSQCMNGHGVCSACKKRLKICPTCDTEFVLIRPTLVNQLLEMMPKPCPFVDNGCSEIMVLCKEHEKVCEFRIGLCKVFNCKWKGCVRDLFGHVRTEHHDILLQFPVEFYGNRYRHVHIELHRSVKYAPMIYNNCFFWYSHSWVPVTHKAQTIYNFFHLPTTNATRTYYLTVTLKHRRVPIEYKATALAMIMTGMDIDETNERYNMCGFTFPRSDVEIFWKDDIHGYNYTVEINEKE